MKTILALLLIACSLSAEVIDSKYDNFEGIPLVLKLIEDQEWNIAQVTFDSEKEKYLKVSPAEYHLIQGLLYNHSNDLDLAIDHLSKSLTIGYSALALSNFLRIETSRKSFVAGFDWLARYERQILSHSPAASEIQFLVQASKTPIGLVKAIRWLDGYLKHSFQFSILKLYVDLLIQNQILNEARIAIEGALDQGNIKSPEEVLTIAESFLNQGLELDVYRFLEKARLRFPTNDLINLNLAQVLFKKDRNLNALTLLSELKPDDSLLSVKLELMNLMQVKAYSLFHRMQFKNSNLHLKNWFVFLINNEDWVQLYSLYPRHDLSLEWMTDEFNYALAYSSLISKDLIRARNFASFVKHPGLKDKKIKLLNSVAEEAGVTK